MLKIFNKVKQNKIWKFKGGIHPLDMKSQSNNTPLRRLPLPISFILPIQQHVGPESEISVQPGDKVLRGQALTFGNDQMLPIHAPTSGTITKIDKHMTASASMLETCLFITPDGKDEWQKTPRLSNYRNIAHSQLIDIIHQAGIAGLGGAGFPTARKIQYGIHKVDTLIINAAESEPYVTADDRLMQECAEEIVEGARILAWVLQVREIFIGIEDNKKKAIRALQKALSFSSDICIRIIPTKYPSGGAQQLIYILTGKEIPHGKHASDIGIIMQNIGTTFAVKRAIMNGESLTERVVTITGASVINPGNIWVRIGTPISYLLQNTGLYQKNQQIIVMGGALMGVTIQSDCIPITKTTNCIIASSTKEVKNNMQEENCIRCGQCADVCPVSLLPQQLYWFSQGRDHIKARAYNIEDCIECGACAYVCPSHIPLVQYYKKEKALIQALDLESQRSKLAKSRFEARQKRLLRTNSKTINACMSKHA
ncbi:Electron transport complex subunit RsxC [Candidatus Erwinia haradaeae]|uniref:Ion-translocating oxidoreductase complex subunit C n=1 Tax=Candidatus Erwinia haradaeae TaxID=1922217 RepID=A0A451DBY5_9GAMM|nr:electron transport complex subunit RsxC [Candidatus Erwinia haradaeae]VFP83922.1 Electron transport complex subunit RsxC [Candidatus Erwinia haradaeae]